jgi:hypothetical protein
MYDCRRAAVSSDIITRWKGDRHHGALFQIILLNFLNFCTPVSWWIPNCVSGIGIWLGDPASMQ